MPLLFFQSVTIIANIFLRVLQAWYFCQNYQEIIFFSNIIYWIIMPYRWLSQKMISLMYNTLKEKVALKISINSVRSTLCIRVIMYWYWQHWAVANAVIQNILQRKRCGEPGQIPKMRNGISTDREIVLVIFMFSISFITVSMSFLFSFRYVLEYVLQLF